jgi:hypothetical protein
MDQINFENILNDLVKGNYFKLMLWNHVFSVSSMVFERFGGPKSKNEPPLVFGYVLCIFLGINLI